MNSVAVAPSRRLGIALPAILTFSLALGLAACGGSSSSSSTGGGGTPTTTISGTAATGSPISGGGTGSLNGVVTLKDSSSPANTATTPTDSNGHYSFSLDNTFHAPYMLEINYQVAGVEYNLHSAGTAADISGGQGTINITPLTDLVIANLGHDIASNIFKNANYTALLTPAAIVAGQAALEIQLAPLLTQLGVSTSVDLFHNAFQANGTGVDALLDALRVNVDPLTKLATITNKLNNTSLTDDVTATSANTTTLSTAGTTVTTVTDLQGISAAFKAFTDLWATSPATTNTNLLAMFDQTGFLDDGKRLAAFLQELPPVNLGGAGKSVTTISLNPVPTFASTAIPSTATTSYLVKLCNNVTCVHDFIMYKSSAGAWIILGDQRIAQAQLRPVAASEAIGAAGNGSIITCSGLEFDVQDSGGIPGGKTLSYAIATGPGLPTAGVLLYNSGGNNSNSLNLAAGGPSTYNGTSTPQFNGNGNGGICNSQDYWMSNTVITSLGQGGVYTIALYNDNGTAASPTDDVKLAQYSAELAYPPLPTTQLNGVFATNAIATPSLASLAVLGGNTTFTWTAPTAANLFISEVNFYLPTGNNSSNNFDLKIFASATATSVQAAVPKTTIPNGDSAGMSIWYTDPEDRAFIAQF